MKQIKLYNPLFFLIFFFILIYLVNYFYLLRLTDSSFLISLTTFLVGIFAIYLYIQQKIDYKSDAANIILTEIKSAEAKIKEFKNNPTAIDIDSLILPVSNWSKYKYLFIKDLDPDEFNLINDFYNKCNLIDSALSSMTTYAQLRQKSSAIHETLCRIAEESTNKVDYENKAKKFRALVEGEAYLFPASYPRIRILEALNNIRFVTATTTGEELKKIAKLK